MITKLDHVTTAEQLLALPNDGNRYELVGGSLKVMSPAGSEHGRVVLRIATRLTNHVKKHDLGVHRRRIPHIEIAQTLGMF